MLRLEPASADASFRRYFRVWRASGSTAVVMDAPPDKEDTAPYLHVGGLLRACGVHVPEVEAVDTARGFLLLEDLGSTHMLARLRAGGEPDRLYGEALAALALIQLRGASATRELAALRRGGAGARNAAIAHLVLRAPSAAHAEHGGRRRC